MFNHQKMKDAQCPPADKQNPTPGEIAVARIRILFGQLQADRHRADYDVGWKIEPKMFP